MERKPVERVESVHRALTLLKLVLAEGSISVTEAGNAIGINASTAYRLLSTLEQDGFVTRREDRRYITGTALRAATPGEPVPSLTSKLRPYLERLFERTGETVHVATLAGTRIQHLDGIEASTHSLRFSLRVGVWLPAHVTAGGKVLLADLADEEVDARYHMALAGPRGRRIKVDLASLHAQIEDVRASRVAWNFEESEPGIAALAVSTGDLDGQRAAISVALPIARFTKEKGERWTRHLIEIAHEIRRDLSTPPAIA